MDCPYAKMITKEVTEQFPGITISQEQFDKNIQNLVRMLHMS